MMKKAFYRFNGVLALLVCLLTFTACSSGKDDDNGGGSKIDERLKSLLPDGSLEKIAKYMPVYSGTNPPNVEGSWAFLAEIMNPSEQYGYEAGDENMDPYLHFENQNQDRMTVGISRYEDMEDWADDLQTAYICGSGNNFTVFYTTQHDFGIRWELLHIISGTVTSDGIKNMHEAEVFVSVEIESDKFPAVGEFFVYKDKDGLSESIELQLYE